MSFEGYYQYLCERGHYWWQDCYSEEIDQCPICGAKLVLGRLVDTTNDAGDPLELAEVTPRQQCKCSACGVEHTSVHPTYRVKETK